MDFAEQVKSRADISEIVGEYVRLKKFGARLRGLCPFHSEKTPSFYVNDQFYKCFGCGAGGDVFNFVMQMDGLTFYEALKALAERYSIPIPQRRQYSDAETDLREAVQRMNTLAADAFRANLAAPAGAEARAYLDRRGVSPEMAEQFGIGYAERGGQALVRLLQTEGFTAGQMEESGLVSKRTDGSGFYDRFRHRLIFPIHNESGKVIGFGGRALSADDEPKYLNSPETLFYKKKLVLYNLHRAKDGMRREQFAVLVEGYMDTIGVARAGVRPVVASCGTALSPEHVRAIKRHTGNVIVNFDPDNAGASAAEKSIQILLDEGMSVRVLTLDEGLDPDEYVNRFGAERYREKLAAAPGYFTWLADRARRKFDMKTADGRMSGFEFLLPAIQRIHDKIERAAVVSEVADYLNVDRGLVLDHFRKAAVSRTEPVRLNVIEVPHKERILIRTLLSGVEARDILAGRLQASTRVRGWQSAPVLATICKLHETQREFQFTELEARLGQRERDLLAFIVFADSSDEVLSAEQALEWLQKLEREERDAQVADLRVKVKEAERAGNLEAALSLMRELNEAQRG